MSTLLPVAYQGPWGKRVDWQFTARFTVVAQPTQPLLDAHSRVVDRQAYRRRANRFSTGEANSQVVGGTSFIEPYGALIDNRTWRITTTTNS